MKYPVGIQTFSKIREGGYLYVDKTASLIPLIENGGYYFLSRPRRFGKSLMLTTLKAYYEGRRDLFKGLALDSLVDNWEPRLVLHLDLNTGDYDSAEKLEAGLKSHVKQWEKIYGTEDEEAPLSQRFGYVIKRAYEQSGRKVAILIDEYDKPMLNAFGDEKLADEFRNILKAFYSNLKTFDSYIELAVITGVARFSKVSIFSDLNNLRDISFTDEFAAVCGITPQELDTYFQEGMRLMGEKLGKTAEEIRVALRENYDGYHFSKNSPDIYNPFSLICAFADSDIKGYWFRSGTPTYLVKLIEQSDIEPFRLVPMEITANELESAGILSADPVPAFYQAGYLTIKEYDPEFKTYTLGYPNKEVKEGFLEFLVPYYLAKTSATNNRFSIKTFVKQVREGRIEDFMKSFESLVANVPYSAKGTSEDHFQTAVYLLFTLLGYHTVMEERVSTGRIDLSVETDRYIYLFEFKINQSARKAMDQIRARRYWTKYLSSGKEIYLIGANFDSTTRSLDDIIIERP